MEKQKAAEVRIRRLFDIEEAEACAHMMTGNRHGTHGSLHKDSLRFSSKSPT
jgi:hypothetical protein